MSVRLSVCLSIYLVYISIYLSCLSILSIYISVCVCSASIKSRISCDYGSRAGSHTPTVSQSVQETKPVQHWTRLQIYTPPLVQGGVGGWLVLWERSCCTSSKKWLMNESHFNMCDPFIADVLWDSSSVTHTEITNQANYWKIPVQSLNSPMWLKNLLKLLKELFILWFSLNRYQ